MKKAIFSLAFVGLVLAAPALAATTMLISPASVAVTAGESFSVAVSVNPGEVKNYTVKLAMEYPADVLEATSFTFGSGWMALPQAGYDLIDNGSGTLIKTAGYPGGLSSAASFGTVVFKAKQTGSAAIEVTANSLALDAQNQNAVDGLPVRTLVSVTAPTVISEEETQETFSETEALPEEEAEVEEPTTGSGEETPDVSAVQGPNRFLAAVSRVITFGTGNNVLSIIFLFVAGIAVYGVYTLISTRKKKKS